MAGYWSGLCADCEQGRLLVMCVIKTDRLFLICEECEALWISPECVATDAQISLQELGFDEAAIASGGWSDKERSKFALATQEDIARHDWLRYQPAQIL